MYKRSVHKVLYAENDVVDSLGESSTRENTDKRFKYAVNELCVLF